MLVVFEDKSKLIELIYPNFDGFNKEIFDLIVGSKQKEELHPTISVSKMTDWNLHDEIKLDLLSTNSISGLNQIISYVIDKIKTNFNPPHDKLTCKYCWGVIYNKGHLIKAHDHLEEGRYSFVYYVNAPEGSAPLIFSDFKYDVTPYTGKLLIFDSRLMHHVPENDCEGRVSLVGVID
jgi:hypothetical protein